VINSKTGIVFVDVGWHRRTGERHGFPATDEAEVVACWNVDDETNPLDPVVNAEFENVEDAIAWANERAPMVLVRLGSTEDKVYSTGERQATRELAEFGGTDLTPYPNWPPDDWS
jgi:hypothetical protein